MLKLEHYGHRGFTAKPEGARQPGFGDGDKEWHLTEDSSVRLSGRATSSTR